MLASEVRSHQLSKEDIKSIKQAQTIVIHGTIDEVKRASAKMEFRSIYNSQPSLIIETSVAVYGPNSSNCRKIFAFLSSSHVDEIWNTILMVIKPGDYISLDIQSNWHKPVLDFDEINLDTLVVNIYRKNKKFIFILKVELTKKDRRKLIQ